jgi:uncharacterized protein
MYAIKRKNNPPMNKLISKKIKKLELTLIKMDKVLIAFSAGVDSTFLLKLAVDLLGKNALAVTACSVTYPKKELEQAKTIAKNLGARLKIIHTSELKTPKFLQNCPKRCYYCKKELFKRLTQIAEKEKIKYILDGSNLDDRLDFRPGNIAKQEFKVRSPLAESGFTKKEIRNLSKVFGLNTWNKPSLACLASRVPYGKRISPRVLRRIEKGEQYLCNLGFDQVRLRDYGNLARIEVEKSKIKQLIHPRLRYKVIDRLKNLGYNYVTVDLDGYRTGSMNLSKIY